MAKTNNGSADHNRRIRVIETGEVYDNIHDAAAAVDGSVQCIRRVLKGQQEKHKGYSFALAGEEDFAQRWKHFT